ncbi:MAG: FAD-linked oxidase C-terminal domain-containing protein [Anaerolineae bacterium]|jgi:glycolate oxidase
MVDQTLLKEFRNIVGKKHVLTEPEDLVAYSYDGTFAERRPDLVVRPDSTEQVSQVMQVAWREEIHVVPRGMASGLAAASIPMTGGMVLDTCRMNRILEIDELNFTVTAQAGVITQHLADTVAKKGLFYPPDPSSIKQSTLGGNAACNAGGPRCLKYGVTSDYVMGLTTVLADGRILKSGGKAIKNVTGYNLTQLFVGSEGTLGVITELVLKLIPQPKVARTAKAVFPKLPDASECVNNILNAGITPATIELMDETAIATIEEAMNLGLPLDVEAILIIEADGMDQESVVKEIETIAEICRATGARDVEVARTEAERAQLWTARRSISPSLARRAPNKLGEDISVPRSAIPEAVAAIKEISAKHDIPIAIFGHAGDGNLHPNILFDRRDPDQVAKMKKAAGDIFEVSVRLGGTLSGEHGVGNLKMAFLEQDIGPISIDVMTGIKKALDPKNILNPGKVVPGQLPGEEALFSW